MKKVAIFILTACLLTAAWAQDFEARGFRVVSSASEGQYTVYRISDGRGYDVSVALTPPTTDKQRAVLDGATETLFSLKNMRIASVRFSITGNRADIVVVPSVFRYKDRDLAVYLPSGFQMAYTDFLEYDFRMVVDNLFIRVNGQYFSEEQFSERLYSISQNPGAYVQSQDPEYVLKKFRELDRIVEDLKGGTDRLRNENKSALDALAKSHEEFKAALTKDFELLRYALQVLNNKGWFGSINLPPKEGVARLLALKKASPGLSMKEAEDKLKAEGVTMSSNEVFLVFGVYFNEFK
jgi:hypothetical protein